MADIKQAGVWLAEGKAVRRSTWLHNARIDRQKGYRTGGLLELYWDEGGFVYNGDLVLSISDLTSEDWEITA